MDDAEGPGPLAEADGPPLADRPRRSLGVLAALDRPLVVGFITTLGVLGALLLFLAVPLSAQNTAPEKGKKDDKPVVVLGELPPEVLAAAKAGTPLLAMVQEDGLADGVAKQLAGLGLFSYAGQVGGLRAPWMGNWNFVRAHTTFAGLLSAGAWIGGVAVCFWLMRRWLAGREAGV